MIHFLPDTFTAETAFPCDDAIARLVSIRTALIVAEQVAGNAAGAADVTLPVIRADMAAARRRCFDQWSIESAQAAAAGLEVLAAQRAAGAEAHPRAVATLADTLRAELNALNLLFSL